MASIAKKSVVTLFAGAAIVTGIATPASAAPNQDQDGLVNVAVGDVTFLNDVNVGVVANVAATLCDVADVGPVAAGVLGRAIAVDNSGRDQTICETAAGEDVTLTQN